MGIITPRELLQKIRENAGEVQDICDELAEQIKTYLEENHERTDRTEDGRTILPTGRDSGYGRGTDENREQLPQR